jgi:hypothetical protein
MIRTRPYGDQAATLRYIPGIEEALRSCADSGLLLSEAGLVPVTAVG